MNLTTLQAMAVRDVARGRGLTEAIVRVSGGARIVLTRFGQPVAGVVSLDDLQRLADGTSRQGRKAGTR